MSFDQRNGADAQNGLTVNLASNNPFRNRNVSPLPGGAPPRPISRNPFLDEADLIFDRKENVRPEQQHTMSPPPAAAPRIVGNAATLFDELTLDDKPTRPSPPNRSITDHARKENLAPPRQPIQHRPSRSQEQANGQRQRTPANGTSRRQTEQLDIFADNGPQIKSPERRLRRNSDSSLMDRKSIDEEKRRQERRRRERREREEKEGKTGKPKKPSRKLDIIDQLDATSIYGTGLFHHDGPFDACRPDRNKKSARAAPMQAFAPDSMNNSLRGGPNNAKADHSTFLGQANTEAFTDYSRGGSNAPVYEGYNGRGPQATSKSLANVQSAVSKVEPVHGDMSMGLGTSTFLDGAPASRAAIQKSAEEQAAVLEAKTPGGVAGGGLGRKKSIAQKIRGISNNRRELKEKEMRDYGYGPTVRSAEPRYSPGSPMYTPGAGRESGREYNPFFNESGQEVNKNGELITAGERDSYGGRIRAPSEPRDGRAGGLERRVTSDSIGMADGGYGAEKEQKSGGGFLSRVKSLKGGPRRPRAEKPVFD